MISKTLFFDNLDELKSESAALKAFAPSLLIAFASASFFEQEQLYITLKDVCPNVIGCSTAGEISGTRVLESCISICAIRFESNAHVKVYETHLTDMQHSSDAGAALLNQIDKNRLKGIYLLAPGIDINGSALIEGLIENLPKGVSISGGLAGDNGSFEQTFVMHNNGVSTRSVVAVAFYGDQLSFEYGAHGGWRSFGPARSVSSAKANELFELDNKPALDIYKNYLGEYAKDLPASGLLFPFEVLSEAGTPTGIIRTILGIDEEAKSLILAGEVNENQYLRLMHASTDDLISGALEAISPLSTTINSGDSQSLALVTSCVGRKLVMGDRVEEEIEEVGRRLPKNTSIAGFYSYGEVSPSSNTSHCELHNQTLTIMLLREKP